jgi:hypothetical protein
MCGVNEAHLPTLASIQSTLAPKSNVKTFSAGLKPLL